MAAILGDVEDVVDDGVFEVDPDVLLEAEEVVESVEHQAGVPTVELHGFFLGVKARKSDPGPVSQPGGRPPTSAPPRGCTFQPLPSISLQMTEKHYTGFRVTCKFSTSVVPPRISETIDF